MLSETQCIAITQKLILCVKKWHHGKWFPLVYFSNQIASIDKDTTLASALNGSNMLGVDLPNDEGVCIELLQRDIIVDEITKNTKRKYFIRFRTNYSTHLKGKELKKALQDSWDIYGGEDVASNDVASNSTNVASNSTTDSTNNSFTTNFTTDTTQSLIDSSSSKSIFFETPIHELSQQI